MGEGKVQEVTASRIAIKKNKSGNMCVTNNQILATTTRTKSAWKKYIHDQHTELWCKYRGGPKNAISLLSTPAEKILVLLSASVERFGVSRTQDFLLGH